MTTSGYYRFPTIHQEDIVFVSEDDLWHVPAGGGTARRLTSNLGEVSYPMLSPDGQLLAFVGREEGAPEVYVMPALGGPARRLTYLSSNCRVVGWMPDGERIIFTSNYGQVVPAEMALFTIRADCPNGAVEPLPYGAARSIAFGPAGQVVIGRNTGDPARWKRYRGGTAGHLWIDPRGDGHFQRFLPELRGNIASPMWLEATGESRIFFVSDHEGIGNLYSCRPDGSDLQRHTDHEAYYVRNPSSDGRRIVYHVGADLYVYDPVTDGEHRVDVAYHSPRVQRNRKFVDAGRYMDCARLHPSGKAIAMTTRGKIFTFANHEGPVIQHGKRDGVRYRQPDWLNDGRHLVVVSDEPGEESLEIYDITGTGEPRRLEGLDLGRVVELKVSPTDDKVALTNHRHELILVDLEQGSATVVDRSPSWNIAGFDWSPDGRWLAYGFGATMRTTEIRLYRLPEPADDSADGNCAGRDPARGQIYTVTKPVLHDVQPTFDPDGKYLYFLSYREFNPVYDGLHFDLGFPWGMRPYLVTLQADLPNPFIPQPDWDEAAESEDEAETEEGEEETEETEGEEAEEEAPEEEDDQDEEADDIEEEDYQAGGRRSPGAPPSPPGDPAPGNGQPGNSGPRKKVKPIRIDVEGIERRVLAFPVPDSRYGQIAGLPNKALFTVLPIHGQLDDDTGWEDEEEEAGTLRAYDFKEYKTETLVENVSSFQISRNHKKVLYTSGRRLRVIAAGQKAPTQSGPPRRTGWIDLRRVKVSVDPQREWEQMLREAWRLQRDHFWTEDMSQVDWQAIYHRYYALIERVSTRGEFSDLMWEMQGELGTSHAYEFGGDYRPRPHYGQGFLGAHFSWAPEAGGYRIDEIILGDPWDPKANSPLATPGVDIQVGDVLLAINGQPLGPEVSPAQLLVNQAGNEVLLTLAPRPQGTTGGSNGEGPGASRQGNRLVIVRALESEAPARYRRWVEQNRRYVHEATDGRAGYVHIPDMSPRGYAEFHRGFLAEIERDGLIVDVRYNGGGHVSQLILEKLARRRIGYDLSRWGGLIPYPTESVAGPLVALTNEHAGSDGDIFCHSFKLLKLGPLVGKRTWGGVIGIEPKHPLVDGTITTQPEYSFWFADVGWQLENYGTEPDIEVDITPQDYREGRDPQLEQAVAEILRLLAETPILKPELDQRPSRALPKLPPRT